MRTCTICEIEKPLTEFRQYTTNTKQAHSCLKCSEERAQKLKVKMDLYRAKNPQDRRCKKCKATKPITEYGNKTGLRFNLICTPCLKDNEEVEKKKYAYDRERKLGYYYKQKANRIERYFNSIKTTREDLIEAKLLLTKWKYGMIGEGEIMRILNLHSKLNITWEETHLNSDNIKHEERLRAMIKHLELLLYTRGIYNRNPEI